MTAGRVSLIRVDTDLLCISSRSDFTDESGPPEGLHVSMGCGTRTGVRVSLFEIDHPFHLIVFLPCTKCLFFSFA